MAKRLVLSIVLTFLSIAVLAAYMGLEPQRQAAAAQRQRREAVERGLHLYSQLCSACHGARGEGKVGPNIVGSAYLKRSGFQEGDPSAQRLAQIEMTRAVSRGVPKTPMPAWSTEEAGPLNQEQILEIVSFLLYGEEKDWERAASLAPAPPPAAAPSLATPPDLASQGQQLYQDKGCAACHGPKGEGGVGPALAGFAGDQVAKQVRTPRGTMPAYPPDRLSDQEIKALVAFIESLGPSKGPR